MSKPEVKLTFVALTTNRATKLGWKLKQIADHHNMRQKKLIEKMQNKSRALTDKGRKQQRVLFEELRTEMGISDADWGDGRDWAFNTEGLTDGMVALVHATDECYAAYDDGAANDNDDGCDCLACQVRRAMTTGEECDDQAKPAADLRRLH